MALTTSKIVDTTWEMITSGNAYYVYRDALHALTLEDKTFFIDILINEFERKEIYRRFNDFVGNTLEADIEERHEILAAWEEEKYRHDQEQLLANDEWIERQVEALAKIQKEAQEFRSKGHLWVEGQIKKINPLPVVKPINPMRFDRFKKALIDDRFIHGETSIKQLRDVFGLNDKYLHKQTSKIITDPIDWTGPNFALKSLINILEEKQIIDFKKKSKWEQICPWFMEHKTKKAYTGDALKTSGNSERQEIEIREKIYNAVKNLLPK